MHCTRRRVLRESLYTLYDLNSIHSRTQSESQSGENSTPSASPALLSVEQDRGRIARRQATPQALLPPQPCHHVAKSNTHSHVGTIHVQQPFEEVQAGLSGRAKCRKDQFDHPLCECVYPAGPITAEQACMLDVRYLRQHIPSHDR